MEIGRSEYMEILCSAMWGVDTEIRSEEKYILNMQKPDGYSSEEIKKSEAKIKELREYRERIKSLLTIDELKIV